MVSQMMARCFRYATLWMLIAGCMGLSSSLLLAESQGSDYKGISDPFGDPTAYEFSEDEKNDKEFFHLGRFFMLGVDLGLGSFTGGLGQTNDAAFYAGAHLVYFFDKSLAFEGRGAYIRHQDSLSVNSDINTLIPITFGFRFYPDIKNAPRAIALANPYLVLGGGMYLRTIENGSGASVSTNNTGFYFGGGMEFLIYRRHIYLGADFRYHAVYFDNEGSSPGVDPDANSGNYFSSVLSITYSF